MKEAFPLPAGASVSPGGKSAVFTKTQTTSHKQIHLPVRGGSVNVRTKRREKRTKLLLSAFGNIYPPFIVTPLFRNFSKRTEDLQPPPPSPCLYRPTLRTDRAHGFGFCFCPLSRRNQEKTDVFEKSLSARQHGLWLDGNRAANVRANGLRR